MWFAGLGSPTTLRLTRSISMCIYCGTDKYRKIYEQHHGPIPIDESGRTYDIHHIDGNHFNNDPINLKALSINDHYNIHYQQKDYYACYKLSIKMKLSIEKIKEMAKNNMENRYANGYISPFTKREDGTSIMSDRYASGHISNFTNCKGNKHPRYDSTIYCFENIVTKEKIYSTQYDFIFNQNVNQSHVNSLIKGKRKTHKGWRLL